MESRESSLPSVALCHSLRLSSSPISVSPVWNLPLPLQVLVRISLGRSLLSDGLFLLCFLLCLLRFPISACLLHSVPFSFHYPTWDFLQEKEALRRSPNLILDHEEPDLSPELHSPFNCSKSRVLDSYGSRLCFKSAVLRKFCNSLNPGLLRTLSHG